MQMDIRRLTVEDLPRLRHYWKQNWGDEFIVAHGVTYHPDALDGFVAFEEEEWIGEVTWAFSGDDCEIVSLDSQREGQGIGAALINAVLEEARKRNCKRVFLITTNDNLNALGFYQKRGFTLVKIYPNALDETRKLKPNVPLIGMNNIPLRDEIELEMVLNTSEHVDK
jgi:ribosomal protein S18 acetylase RimI-like enzyme